MNKKITLTCFLLACAVATVCMNACDKDNKNNDDVTNDTQIEVSTDAENVGAENNPDAETDVTTPGDETNSESGEVSGDEIVEEENDENSNKVSGVYNLLTGEECSEELAVKRPCGIMINNLRASIPQLGISLADVLYEVRAEAGITRYLAIFSDYENLPETGSVRSSRDYYIDLAQAHDAIYAHCGGSVYAYNTLAERKINNLDGTNDRTVASTVYFMDMVRRQTMAQEHTIMTDGARLAKGISDKQYRLTLEDGYSAPLSFSKDSVKFEDGLNCNYLYIPFSRYVQAYFQYDTDGGVYKKGQYFNMNSSLDKTNAPQIDGNTGEQIAFKNVIILYAKHSEIAGDDKARISVNLVGEGKGYVATEGEYTEIVWKKADRTTPYKLYLADGETELLINKGKTYIGVVPMDTEVVFK